MADTSTVTDYIAGILVALLGIAAFINLSRGTLSAWLKAKFLGKS